MAGQLTSQQSTITTLANQYDDFTNQLSIVREENKKIRRKCQYMNTPPNLPVYDNHKRKYCEKSDDGDDDDNNEEDGLLPKNINKNNNSIEKEQGQVIIIVHEKILILLMMMMMKTIVFLLLMEHRISHHGLHRLIHALPKTPLKVLSM